MVYEDIGRHVSSYSQLRQAIPQQLDNLAEFRQNRARYTHDHVGPTDGESSQRIVEYLESNMRPDAVG